MMTLDRLKHALLALVEVALARTDYHALYPCRVVSMGDGNDVDLKPDSPRWGAGLAAVPIRHGLPGVTARVRQGARCLLGFEGGDPQRPYCALWEPGSLESLTIEASVSLTLRAPSVVSGMASAKPVARAGDLVQGVLVSGPPGSPVPFTGYITGGAANTRAS